jgi:DNA repair exonuclease SbcCD ATPase subunit
MGILNIFWYPDGRFAWDTLSVLVLAFLAGWLLHRYNSKRVAEKKQQAAIAELERSYKRLEGEYKNYRSNIQATEKHNDKAVIELGNRVKALEGDIRVLADEKNKAHQQVAEKEKETRGYIRQLGEREELINDLKEKRARAEETWTQKLRESGQSLSKALVWEDRVKAAEADANKAREALGHAERRRLDAELRLKATSEYAGRIMPLENELTTKNKLIAELHEKLRASEEITERLNHVSAELESLKMSWHKM